MNPVGHRNVLNEDVTFCRCRLYLATIATKLRTENNNVHVEMLSIRKKINLKFQKAVFISFCNGRPIEF